MIILGLTPHNEFTGETPEEAQLRMLRDFGHTVYIMSTCDKLPAKKIDVIASMSEVTAKNACILSHKFNIPYYAHMEWLPDWRIFRDSEFNWGYIYRLSYRAKMDFVRRYLEYTYYWNMANVKTLSANCFIPTMNDFTGLESEIGVKSVGIDIAKLHNVNVTKDNSISCVGRFVTHKRIPHIIKALQLIGYKGTLKLIGYGDAKVYFEIISKGINIEFIDSKDKLEALKSSDLCVSLWSGMVPAEAFYMDIPVITYESKYMRELYGDTIIYADNNSISSLATAILTVLLIPEEGKRDLARHGVSQLENRKLSGVLTLVDSAKQLENFLKQARVKKQ